MTVSGISQQFKFTLYPDENLNPIEIENARNALSFEVQVGDGTMKKVATIELAESN